MTATDVTRSLLDDYHEALAASVIDGSPVSPDTVGDLQDRARAVILGETGDEVDVPGVPDRLDLLDILLRVRAGLHAALAFAASAVADRSPNRRRPPKSLMAHLRNVEAASEALGVLAGRLGYALSLEEVFARGRE